MPNDRLPLILDGHNDVLLKLHLEGGRTAIDGFEHGRGGHIDLPRARQGGFAGGFFALYVRSPGDRDEKLEEMRQPSYDIALPPAMSPTDALPVILEEAALLLEMHDRKLVRLCTSTDDIRASLSDGRMAAIMHLEGAEPIDPDFYALDVLHAAGLRSIGPVWSRPTIFAEGVPFRFPSGPDTGGGLTDKGRELVRRCNARGIMIDLSHINEAGFWDIAATSSAPLVATHSNAHAICPHARNLTDKQLAAIAESDGMVGLNFATAFLRPDGQMDPDVSLEVMLRHLDHLISVLGEDRVGLGSDFDGAMVPAEISDVAGLTNLRAAMRAHGYDEELMTKLCHENWLRVLARTWGEQSETDR